MAIRAKVQLTAAVLLAAAALPPSASAAPAGGTGDPPALAVALSMSPSSPAARRDSTWTVTVTNPGPTGVTDTQVHLDPPAGVREYDASQGSCRYQSWTGWDCSLGDLAAGATATIAVTSGGTLAAGPRTSSATATATGATPGSASASMTTTYREPATDLRVSVAAAQEVTALGDEVAFDVSVENVGIDHAENVDVYDTLPSGAGHVSTGPCVRRPEPGAPACHFLHVDPGIPETFRVRLKPTQVGQLTYAVRVTQDDADPTPADDEATAHATVRREADLHVAVERESASPVRAGGGVARWAVLVANRGPSDAPGVRLSGDWVFVPVQPFAGTPQHHPLDPRTFDLAAGETRRIPVEAPIGGAGKLWIEPAVESDAYDPIPSDDRVALDRFRGGGSCEACGEVDIGAETDLGVRATATQVFLPGDPASYIDYRIHADNAGPSPTGEAFVFTGHPAGTTPVRWPGEPGNPWGSGVVVDAATERVACPTGLELDPDGGTELGIVCMLDGTLDGAPYPRAADLLYRLRVDAGSASTVSTLFRMRLLPSPFIDDTELGNNRFVAELDPADNRVRLRSPLARTAAVATGSRLRRSGARAVTVPVTCARAVATCRGTVAIRLAHRRTPGRLVASGGFTLAGGQRRTVRVGLPRAARTLLGRRRAVRVQLVTRAAVRGRPGMLTPQQRTSGAFGFRAR